MAFTQSVRTRLENISKLTYVLVIVAVWLVAAIYAWFHVVYQSPESVFKGMLRNNFATTSYARETQSAQGDVTSDEVTQLQLGQEGLVQGVTTLTQGDDKVTTNTITTTNKNFVRYTDIKTNRTGKDGKPLAFDKVIGVWAVSEGQGAGANQAVSQMMLGLIPIGNLQPKDRADLLKQIEKTKAITADYKSVKKETVKGRLQYTYTIKIQPVAYLEVLKRYGQLAGLADQVAALNPSDYKSSPATSLQVTVDAKSHHIVSLTPPGETIPSETYRSFGVHKDVQLPEKAISTDQLQQRLNIQ